MAQRILKSVKQLVIWLGVASALVVVFGTIYVVTQQSQRLAANYPQIQLAEDVASSLDRGMSPYDVVQGYIDMRHSLAPFMIIYDKKAQTIAGSGYLDNKTPTVPYGVLAAANGKDYHSVTWQPADDVRVAAVAVAAKNYYVLSGRNMKEVERSESRTAVLSAFGLSASLLVLAVTWEIRARLPGRL
jgi:hypothetical protein